jgi:hypothetical protein
MAMVCGDRTPAEWFHAAVHSYEADHQGCTHCRNRHCVFRSRWGERIEYYCSACDFSTSHDRATDRYYTALGDGCQLGASLLTGHPEADQVPG